MSKIWLLLLLVAAFQFAHAYPTGEYEIDEYASDEVDEYMSDETDYMSDEETTGSIIREAWNKLKDRFKKVSQEKMRNIIARLKARYCNQEEDFEDDYESDEAQDKVSLQYRLVQKLKELYEKAKAKWGQQKDKLKAALAKIRQTFCAKLNNVQSESDFYDDEDGDEERFKIKKIKIGNVLNKIKQGLKKIGASAKQAMKKGAKMLKNMGVQIRPLDCHEKTCKSCIIFKLPTENSLCLQMRFMKTNKATYLVISGEINQTPKFEQKIKMGELPRCMNIGGFVGKICLKGIEGRAKSSKGQANVNFCLAILAENFGVGCKFCATYENKKLKVKFSPKTFAGTKSEDGDIVQMDKNGEDAVELAADEFEVD